MDCATPDVDFGNASMEKRKLQDSLHPKFSQRSISPTSLREKTQRLEFSRYLPEGKQYMDQLLGKFDIGSQESETFRYCGTQFATTTDGTVDVSDNTLKIKPITIEQGRPNSEALQPHELSKLRSVVGSLSWIARHKHVQICCTLCLNCNPKFRKHVSQRSRTRLKQSILLSQA